MNILRQLHIIAIALILSGCETHENKPMKNVSPSLNYRKNGHALVNGLNMYYEIYGSGFPLVLIHGGGSTINTSWRKMIPLFAKDHQVIAIETQAHGRSDDRDAPETFEQDADDINALLDFLKIDSSDIMGFSNGGSTSLQMAIRHPKKVRKVVAISALCSRDGVQDGFWSFMEKGTFNDMPQIYKDGFLKVNNDSVKLYNMYHKDSQRMLNFKDWDEQSIKSISCPVLLLGGDKDVIKPAHLLKLSTLISNSRLCILPGHHGEFMGEASYPHQKEEIINATSAIISHFLTDEDSLK